MSNLNEPLNLGDLLKYEEVRLNFSREVATVAAGQNLELGAVVGRITATNQIKRYEPGASDGSEVAVGILLSPVDATLMEEETLILARHAVVASHAVVWPAGITPEQKVAAIASLEARGILIRLSA